MYAARATTHGGMRKLKGFFRAHPGSAAVTTGGIDVRHSVTGNTTSQASAPTERLLGKIPRLLGTL